MDYKENKNFQHDKENIKLENKEQHMEVDKIVSRSLMKRLISLSRLGLVKGGAVSGTEIQRAFRNNNREISLDNKRPKLNGGKEMSE